MRRKYGWLVCAVVLIGILLWNYSGKKMKDEEPDSVSSVCYGNELTLIVVANCDIIENKEEFAEFLIEKYKKNSFKTVRLSTDQEQPEKIRMKVYLRVEDFEEGIEPEMVIDLFTRE